MEERCGFWKEECGKGLTRANAVDDVHSVLFAERRRAGRGGRGACRKEGRYQVVCSRGLEKEGNGARVTLLSVKGKMG